jgi:hypothetical protein
VRLTLQQLEAHLWGAANILRGKTAGQDYKNYILSLMFYKRLCDQWEHEADEAIAELERQQDRAFSDKEKAVFRKRGEHRFQIPDGARWGDVKAAATNLGEVLTTAMRAVADANQELRGVFTVDWNQPAPDGSGKPLIPNEVVHALVQHFDEHDLSNASVPPDVLGRAYEYLIKQFADDAGAKAGEFFTPPEVVDTLVRILEPRPAQARATDGRQEEARQAQEGGLRQGGVQGPLRSLRPGHRLSRTARRLRRLRLHPAHPRLAQRRRARRNRLPAGRALPRPAGSRGGDRRAGRRRQPEGKAPQGG